jgi:hypothetical protein
VTRKRVTSIDVSDFPLFQVRLEARLDLRALQGLRRLLQLQGTESYQLTIEGGSAASNVKLAGSRRKSE